MSGSAASVPHAEGGHADEGDYASRRRRLDGQLRAARRSKAQGESFRLQKATSNLFRDRSRKGQRLDLSDFNHVIAVDPAQGWVEAEGMTTYEDLVAATLGHDALPAVVPELKTITIGGAAAGVGIEASSFRHGLVHESIVEFDVLIGGGRVVTCRADNEHQDLFFGFPNSYGTLGYALRLKARTIRAKAYAAVEHRRYSDAATYFAALERECGGDADYIDGVAFGPRELYLNAARFVDSAPYLSDYTFEQMYYRSIRERDTDYLSAHDYVWRWDTDWFWCSKNLGAQIPWIRRLYGRERLGSRTYQRVMRWNSKWGFTRALDSLRGGHSESVIQDVDVPIANAPAFLDFFQREVGLAPVWICPLRATDKADRYSLYPLEPGHHYVNFGFWDVLHRSTQFPPCHFNRLIERRVIALGGIKSLYSESCFERGEFDAIYGGEAYRSLKARYDPDGEFPGLYEKCVLRV